ncbi:DUF5362 family protein [Bhargavaea beijingensis]|uniref:DUF5362 domain-containing protein n=1 Tax=Bhargavaea beijingensis TaxID=426756 RepID=A0A1G7A4I0_9BACL|nr:DUF5362 family protein [Bhargavaea beijingensis]MCW1927288.1 DUF5362 family protein [Bhargavaea beijingensis]RSK35583.1 hypothetical protein EJA12_03150 [Bhargavaea beijingensis]SDE09749.1 hypothetical protein SAMN04488126_103189 [Bhargavaea beijingensis]
MQAQSFEEAVAQKGLQRIALWGKVTGIAMMITGGIYAFFGLFYFIVGAIPGGITLFMGYLIYKTGKSAATIQEGGDTRALSELFHNYGLYLLTAFILVAISVGMFVLMLIIFGFAFFGGMMYNGF